MTSLMPAASLSILAVMRRAMLPLDGAIADYVPAIVAAYARVVKPSLWPGRRFIDLTAGSCLMPLLFAARGMGRVIVNDTAARSQLAAAALFGGRRLDAKRVGRLIATPAARPHTPTFQFACDYLTEPVCEIFDRLYHAAAPAADRPVYRYLALRWVQGFAPSAEEDFAFLTTHDPAQLRAETAHDWGPYLRRLRRSRAVLRELVRNINAGIELVATRRVELHGVDMLELCRSIAYGPAPLVAINPPTRGLDEYVIDDQLIHGLLANRWLPLSRCREAPETFWQKRVEAALRRLPRGGHGIAWGGDGALRWSECLRVWTRFAEPVAVGRVGRGRYAPGWAILEKR